MRATPISLRLLLALPLSLGACGFDGLLFTPWGFEPTAPARVELAGEAEPGAEVLAYGAEGRPLAQSSADEAGVFVLALPPDEPGANLTVLAQSGTRVLKTLVPVAEKGEITGVGRLNATTTALAQLAQYEVQSEAGSTLRATPPAALRGLYASMTSSPSAALIELVALVGELQAASAPTGSEPSFEAMTPALSERFVSAAGLSSEVLERYRQLLGRAAASYALTIRCDPSRLNTMFTVDVSGRALDGNGARQLIRQPPKEGKIYLGFTSDPTSQVADENIPTRLTPNDPRFAMRDDGQGGDEVAGDGVFTVVVPLQRGVRLEYKYTNGAANEGFSGTEEWPGNARILEIEDVLTGRPDGEPDCLVIRRDSFGDESANKNFVNGNTVAKARSGGTLRFDTDLGGPELPSGRGGLLGGLGVDGLRESSGLTPRGVPEARENGVCTVCPAPLILDPDDREPPALLEAVRLGVDRVRVRFSEPILSADATLLGRYQYLDGAGRAVPLFAATVSGSDVFLRLEPTHPTQDARLRVRDLRDVSALGNRLDAAEVSVGPDRTAPRILAARPQTRHDFAPSADTRPDVGDVLELELDERPEESAAGDPARYSISGLQVIAALPLEDRAVPTVRLYTSAQEKGRRYTLSVRGLRDLAGNALDQELSFEGFRRYRARFRAVPGWALLEDGQRGLPRGERLFLTGTPLSVARDPVSGADLSVQREGAVRTDVTGWPEFEMKPNGETYEGQAVYELTLLLPPASYAWKVAHGLPGEQVSAPVTLEKVAKALATTNDGTGVRVDPRTLRADNGLDYSGAQLSADGQDPPRRAVLFKRETLDEACEVGSRDVDCPLIVVGTWRDARPGPLVDYDDGVLPLPSVRPELDGRGPPRLLDAAARDSYSVQLSFDRQLLRPDLNLQVELWSAETGLGLPVTVLENTELPPHQAVARVSAGRLGDGEVYTLRYRGATSVAEAKDRVWRSATIAGPGAEVPFRPLVDREAPQVERIEATDLDELIVRFDEEIDPSRVVSDGFVLTHADTAEPLQVVSVSRRADRRSVRIITALQSIRAPYRLLVRGVQDLADPPNVLPESSYDFTGFGELEPPKLQRVRAIDSSTLLLRFDEPLDAASAGDPARYRIFGLSVRSVEFSAAPGRRELAFSPALAPPQRDLVLISTSPMSAGQTYTVEVLGVRDRSGNEATESASFVAAAGPPSVNVILEVLVSKSTEAGGRIPSRALSLAELSESREGIFVLGARAQVDHRPTPGRDGPVNEVLFGFPPEGQPLDGIEPKLEDNGLGPDRVAGDGVYSILVPNVPLGTTLVWKAFAPYSVRYRDQNPSDRAALYADLLPGPSAFADGQEYPGNENGAIILDEGAEPGVLRLRALFGDEVTYKKGSGSPAYFWAYRD